MVPIKSLGPAARREKISEEGLHTSPSEPSSEPETRLMDGEEPLPDTSPEQEVATKIKEDPLVEPTLEH